MTPNIFWVDDSTIITNLGSKTLSSIGCPTTLAHTVEDALEL